MKKQLLFVAALIVMASTLFAQIPSYVPTNGLVGWWPFNGNANDESGNGNNGTVSGTTYSADRNNNSNSACNLYGSNDYVEISTTNGQFNSQQYTISYWFKTNQNASSVNGGPNVNPAVISRLNVGGPTAVPPAWVDNFVIYEIGGSNHFNTPVNGGATGANTALGNTWKHIVFSIRTDSTITYLNGNRIGASINSGIINFQTFAIRLGRSKYTYWKDFSGELDDVGYWNRALTKQEVTALYNSINCSISATITPQGNTTFCQGGSVTLNGNTGANYTYQWYQNANAIPSATVSNYQATQTGTYTVKITDGACNATSAGVAVTVNALPSLSLTPIANYINLNNSAVNLSANPAGGVYSGSGVSGNMFNPKNAGLGIKTISYSYTNTAGCFNKTSQNTLVYDTTGVVCTKRDTVTTYITVTDTLVININLAGLANHHILNTIKIFPNPTNNHITILYGNFTQMNGYTLKITNALGQLMFSSPINQASSYLDLAGWSGKGIYFVHILNPQNNAVEVRKIVLQ